MVVSRLASLFRKGRLEHELDEELGAHLEMLAAENVSKGMSPEEARYAARREFGGVEQMKEIYRERRGLIMVETMFQDVRYGLRMLVKNPGFTCTAILMLALGIGATVTIFAFVDAALIRPLPYPNPTRLVAVTESIALFPRANLSYPDYLDWKKLNKVFTSLDVWTGTGYLLRTPAGIQPVSGTRVSDGFFRTLGITPVLGRDFYAGEDLASAPHTVVLSYAAWQKWFGGKADVVGRPVTLSGISYTIIGVLPRDFQFAPRGDAGFWATLHASGSCDLRRSCHSLDGIARLKDGVSVQTALADMKSIAQQLERQYPDSNRGQGASVVPLSEVIVGDIRPILLVLLGGAGLLLLIACVNVTSLLLARSESRKREIAVRNALGASAARLVRQFATEGLVLVALSSALGLLSAEWLMQTPHQADPAVHDGRNALPARPWFEFPRVGLRRRDIAARRRALFHHSHLALVLIRDARRLGRRRSRFGGNHVAPLRLQPGGGGVGHRNGAIDRRRAARQELLSSAPCGPRIPARSSSSALCGGSGSRPLWKG